MAVLRRVINTFFVGVFTIKGVFLKKLFFQKKKPMNELLVDLTPGIIVTPSTLP
jgi:hypothetical protein